MKYLAPVEGNPPSYHCSRGPLRCCSPQTVAGAEPKSHFHHHCQHHHHHHHRHLHHHHQHHRHHHHHHHLHHLGSDPKHAVRVAEPIRILRLEVLSLCCQHVNQFGTISICQKKGNLNTLIIRKAFKSLHVLSNCTFYRICRISHFLYNCTIIGYLFN